MQAIRQEWARRVQAEYCSALLTQEITLQLMRLGAPPDLVRDGMRIAEEELSHAEMSLEVFRQAGGEGTPTVDTSAALLEQGDLFTSTLSSILRIFCLGETVAVPLFANLRQHCKKDFASEVFDQILRDEVGHRQFGWDVLDWFIATVGEEQVKEVAESVLPAHLAAMHESYSGGADHHFDNEARVWGLAPPSEYSEILDKTVATEYIPRFAARNISI